MRHADRCEVFNRPTPDNDMANALVDASVNLPAGKMLVYYVGRSGSASRDLRIEAAKVALKLKLSLVQWPNRLLKDCATTEQAHNREWCYALQRSAT